MIAVPTDAIGLLIGKAGKTLTKISKESGARVSLQAYDDIEYGSRERAVIIHGIRHSIVTALKLIIAIFVARKTTCMTSLDSTPSTNVFNSGENETTKEISTNNSNFELLKWIIPQSMCGKLIGKGGDGIKLINSKSGAWVKIAHIEEISPGTDERYSMLIHDYNYFHDFDIIKFYHD
jgi:polyribonucleotide nucleotidyltransferase